MKFDFHTHHERCGHAVGRIEDYIESAIDQGLERIGISDHTPILESESDQLKPGISMAKSEFPLYVAEVLQLKKRYSGKIEVLLGVECDFVPTHSKLYHEFINRYPFDYVIGSVHYLEGVSIFSQKRWEGLNEPQRIQAKEAYYRLIQQSAKSGMFDILGHIDAMKARYPAFSEIPTEVVDQTLQIIADQDVVIEVNTSGKTKPCGGWYPSHDILERAYYYGVKVTFGSDSHTPERVGEEWDEVRQVLREIGYTQWAVFRQRQREMVDLYSFHV